MAAEVEETRGAIPQSLTPITLSPYSSGLRDKFAKFKTGPVQSPARQVTGGMDANESSPPTVAIPIIDISSLTGPNPAFKASTVDEISRACREIGFMVITNHGVPDEVVRDMWDVTAEFFDLG